MNASQVRQSGRRGWLKQGLDVRYGNDHQLFSERFCSRRARKWMGINLQKLLETALSQCVAVLSRWFCRTHYWHCLPCLCFCLNIDIEMRIAWVQHGSHLPTPRSHQHGIHVCSKSVYKTTLSSQSSRWISFLVLTWPVRAISVLKSIMRLTTPIHSCIFPRKIGFLSSFTVTHSKTSCGSVSKPCTPDKNLKIAGIYGCSFP